MAASRTACFECVLCCSLGPLIVLRFVLECVLSFVFFSLVRMSVPVQVTDWKDSSPK